MDGGREERSDEPLLALGIIPPNGERKPPILPHDPCGGTTLAIVIEPIGGSPTQQPTGPVVFVGAVEAVRS